MRVVGGKINAGLWPPAEVFEFGKAGLILLFPKKAMNERFL
jgi:hypothetical protein